MPNNDFERGVDAALAELIEFFKDDSGQAMVAEWGEKNEEELDGTFTRSMEFILLTNNHLDAYMRLAKEEALKAEENRVREAVRATFHPPYDR